MLRRCLLFWTLGMLSACLETSPKSSSGLSRRTSSSSSSSSAKTNSTNNNGAALCNGQSLERLRYTSASAGTASCAQLSVREVATCNNGFPVWPANFSLVDSCSESRTYYAFSHPAVGINCVSQVQSRTCTNGTCQSWSGSYTQSACTESQIRYAAATVPPGGLCMPTTATRLCQGGTCGNWGGTNATATSCVVQGSSSCALASLSIPSGNSSPITRYDTNAVSGYLSSCVAHAGSLSATCQNGTLSFPADSNFVNATCTDHVYRYLSGSPALGQACVGEDQMRSYEYGMQKSQSGSYTQSGCTESRERFQSALVSAGQSCVSEIQTRSCFANSCVSTWTSAHNYTQERCEVATSSTGGSPRLSMRLGMYLGALLRSNGDLLFWGDHGNAFYPTPTVIMNHVQSMGAVAPDISPFFYLDSRNLTLLKSNGDLVNGLGSLYLSGVQKFYEAPSDAVTGGIVKFAIKTDDSLWAVGTNSNLFVNAQAPNAQKLGENVDQVFAGYKTLHFLKKDKTLWGMGSNKCGAVGDGTHLDRSTPVQVLSNVQQVSMRADTVFAVKTDGSLWGWGSGAQGQLGTEEALENWSSASNFGAVYCSRSVVSPRLILTNVQKVFVGYQTVFALKTDGTLWSFGSNGFIGWSHALNASTGLNSYYAAAVGSLGDGSRDLYRVQPRQIMSGVNTVYFNGLSIHVLKLDGSLWAFGQNSFGELGDGTRENRYSPAMILTNVIDLVESSVYMSMNKWHWTAAALRSDGSLWGFGIPLPAVELSGHPELWGLNLLPGLPASLTLLPTRLSLPSLSQ